MASFSVRQILQQKKASEKGLKIRDSLKLIKSYGMKTTSDACNNYISAKFYIALPLVNKMCELSCLLTT